MSSNKEETVFQALKYSGENFFDNKNELDSVRRESELVCQTTKNKLPSFKSDLTANNPKGAQQIEDYLFDSLKLTEPTDVKYEERRECSPEEENIITEECRKKGKTDSDIKEIKKALGFKVKNETDKEFKKPCVAVVGQTKAGKSSLINALLGAKAVPQKLTKQTARVTYMTYCEIEFVAYMQKGNHENKLIDLRVDENIKEEDVDLKFEDRRKAVEVNVEVRVGVKNFILRNGFDIVDSPGLNENPALNELCQKMEKSLVPLLIYVIDGRNGLTETDIIDIKNIREHTPQIKILYFITKLDRTVIDRAMYERTKKRKNIPEDENLPGESDTEVADRRLKKVFWKLQKNAFVSPSLDFDKCEEFNGCNLAAIQSFRIAKKNPVSKIDKKSVELFDKFELNLLHDLKHMIEEPLNTDIASMRTALENVLENATILASNIMNEKQEKIISLDHISLTEKELFETQKKQLDERKQKISCLESFISKEETMYRKQSEENSKELRTEINKMLDQYEKSLGQILESHEFEEKRLKKLPDSALKKKNPQLYDEKLLPFRHDIREFIEKTLQTQMEDFIALFLWKSDEKLTEKLNELVEKLSGGKYGQESFKEMLKNRLFYAYDLTEQCCITRSQEYVYKPVKMRKNNNLLVTVREKIHHLTHSSERQQQQQQFSRDTEWKEGEAKKIFSELDRKNFIENICSKVTDEFQKNHDKFATQMTKDKNFLESDLGVGEKEKDYLKKFCEEIAVLYTRTLMVSTNIHLLFDENRESIHVGSGGQATIDKIYLLGQDDPIVQKSYKKVFNDWTNSAGGKNLALEVYYTSRLNDPCFLKLYGFKQEIVEEGHKFISFYPYYPLGSLKNYLENHEVSLDVRKKLAIDIASGIHRLHELKIIHRDITLKNILVSKKDDSAVPQCIIGDFGVLSLLAFADKIRHSTSANTAWEIYNQEELNRHGYTLASDVYSYGVSLWQLLSFKLKPEYDNYEPQYVIDCWKLMREIKDREEHKGKSEEQLFDELTKEKICAGEKPEPRDGIPSDLNQLLEECWDPKKENRPTMDQIANRLEKMSINQSQGK